MFPASGCHHVFQLFPNSGYDDPNTLLGAAFSSSGSEPSGMLRFNPEESPGALEVSVSRVTFIALAKLRSSSAHFFVPLTTRWRYAGKRWRDGDGSGALLSPDALFFPPTPTSSAVFTVLA